MKTVKNMLRLGEKLGHKAEFDLKYKMSGEEILEYLQPIMS
jgi:hypothetical protein